MPSLPSDAPAHLVRAHRDAKIQRDGDDREAVVWDEYYRAQGGMGIDRTTCIKLAKRLPTGLSRYGDAVQPRPFGVETLGTPVHSADEEPRSWLVESSRRVWSIERPQVRRYDWRRQLAETAKPASPRTSVNNCTVRPITDSGSDWNSQVASSPEQLANMGLSCLAATPQNVQAPAHNGQPDQAQLPQECHGAS